MALMDRDVVAYISVKIKTYVNFIVKILYRNIIWRLTGCNSFYFPIAKEVTVFLWGLPTPILGSVGIETYWSGSQVRCTVEGGIGGPIHYCWFYV